MRRIVRAVWLREFGGPNVLRLEEGATPRPGEGEALVRVAAAGVNFHDVNQRAGRSRGAELPLIVGNEGSGTVEAVGPGVGEVRIGDRVTWVMHQGTYTTHAVVPAEKLVPVPEQIDVRAAAAIPMQGLMAHGLALDAYPVRKQDVVLVQSAASGIGGLVSQVAKLRGATVIGTVSRAEKVTDAKAAGVDEVIVRADGDVAGRVRDASGGRGASVVYDGIGKDTFQSSLDSLGPRGVLVIYGAASGPFPAIDTTWLSARGGLSVTRVLLGHFIPDRVALLARMRELFDWMMSGKVTFPVRQRFPLEEAARAHAAVESGTTTGKLVIDVA